MRRRRRSSEEQLLVQVTEEVLEKWAETDSVTDASFILI